MLPRVLVPVKRRPNHPYSGLPENDGGHEAAVASQGRGGARLTNSHFDDPILSPTKPGCAQDLPEHVQAEAGSFRERSRSFHERVAARKRRHEVLAPPKRNPVSSFARLKWC